jgi:hypothetical protein
MKFITRGNLDRRWDGFRAMLTSGKPDSEYRGSEKRCHICIYVGLRDIKILLPAIIKPLAIKHTPVSWTAEDHARLGRDHYFEYFPREYGFSVDKTTLHLHHGPQTWDSSTTKSRVYFFPWAAKRFHRFSLYDLQGGHFWTKFESDVTKARKAWRKAGAKGWFSARRWFSLSRITTTS